MDIRGLVVLFLLGASAAPLAADARADAKKQVEFGIAVAQKGLWREVFSTIGYLTVNPKEQHLGLGRDTKADITILWPNGERETHKGLAADKRYHFIQGTKQAAK